MKTLIFIILFLVTTTYAQTYTSVNGGYKVEYEDLTYYIVHKPEMSSNIFYRDGVYKVEFKLWERDYLNERTDYCNEIDYALDLTEANTVLDSLKKECLIFYFEFNDNSKIGWEKINRGFMKYEKEVLEILDQKPHLTTGQLAEHLQLIYPESKLVSIRRRVEEIRKEYGIKPDVDVEIIKKTVQIAKQKQKAQDINRIERKSFREYARAENAIAELAAGIKEQLKLHAKELSKIKINPIKRSKSDGIGVFHWTDLHGNELINLPHNKYDFKILSKRLKLYNQEALDEFKFRGINKVLISVTGDLLNSDRRLDEILNASTNRSKAAVLMVHILKQAILHIRNEGFQVDIVSVLGNEARIGQEMPFSNEGLSDNYDFTIMAMLKELFGFAKISGVNFLSIDKVEEVVDVNGQKWLLAHDVSRFTDKQEKSQSAIGRYSLQGIKIEYIIGGHIHATRITDITSRASSFSGSNSFNENALNLAGRASGTFYIVKNKRRMVFNIDLQDVNGIDGYEVVSKLEAYHAKSAEKLEPQTVIHKIVI